MEVEELAQGVLVLTEAAVDRQLLGTHGRLVQQLVDDPVDGPLAAAAQQADESAVSQLDTVFDLAEIRESGRRR